MTMRKPSMGSLLVIDDDIDLLEIIRDYYRPRGYKVEMSEEAETPLERFRKSKDEPGKYDVIICDLKMPKFDGMTFIREMKAIGHPVPVILMTGHSSVELAFQAVKEGAYDFVTKPLNFSQLTVSIDRAMSLRKMQNENEALRSAISVTHTFDQLTARSPEMLNILQLAKRVAQSSANVLVNGESGTGKEVVAKLIHRNSPRKDGPWVAINCSAIPENLLESELFGHAKGAFTGASDKKLGLFEEADGGTLFLDEIGDLSLPLQAKILRVIQERKIKRIGENQDRNIDVRLIAATHKNLAEEVGKKTFRQDLFFRLNVIRMELPPLRARKEDLLPLADLFLKKFSAQNKLPTKPLARSAQQYLYQYTWPGNVRELENAIERAVILCQGTEIEMDDLKQDDSFRDAWSIPEKEDTMEPLEKNEMSYAKLPEQPILPEYDMGLPQKSQFQLSKLQFDEMYTLNDLNLKYIEYIMEKVGGVRERAARILDIDRKTLYRKLDEIKKQHERDNGQNALPSTEFSHQ